MQTLSPWIIVHEFCATRVFEGTDPDKVENRVAFIEKSPRIRIREFSNLDDDYKNWQYGPKGSGGGMPEIDQTYGFDLYSRAWCDEQLIKMGYTLM